MILGGPMLNQNYSKMISSVEASTMEWKALAVLCDRTAKHAQVADDTLNVIIDDRLQVKTVRPQGTQR